MLRVDWKSCLERKPEENRAASRVAVWALPLPASAPGSITALCTGSGTQPMSVSPQCLRVFVLVTESGFDLLLFSVVYCRLGSKRKPATMLICLVQSWAKPFSAHP